MDLVTEALKVFQNDPTRKNYRVGIILMAPSGRCLALKRSETKKLGGGTWGVPGGKVEEGETLGQAALREAGEETSVYPEAAILIHAETAGDIEFRTFVGYVDEEFIPTLDHEHTDYEWVLPNHWPQPVFSGMKSVLEDSHAMNALKRPLQQQRLSL